MAERLTIVSGVVIGGRQRSGSIKDTNPLITAPLIIYLLNVKESADVVRLLMVSLIISIMCSTTVAEESGLNEVANNSSSKAIRFKLITGGEYPLCQDYVDMLNKTEYTENPICERTILPGFSKFREVKWEEEITDKEEIWRIKSESIKHHSLWPPIQKDKIDWKLKYYKNKYENEGYPSLYKARVDMDHDGKKDTVYKFIYPYTPDRDQYDKCTHPVGYFTLYDDPEKNRKIYSKPMPVGSPAKTENTGIFYYDGRIFQDYWSGLGARYHLKVNETTGISNQVCGINIVQ